MAIFGAILRMNYFAHGRPFVEDPYFLAGTAVPDWLSVVDRRVRARSRLAAKRLDDPDRHLVALAQGVMRHHHDDAWFHQTRAFAELNLQFSASIRQRLPGDEGFRPSFLGHILVEILLDADLIEQNPDQLDAYYGALAALDPLAVSDRVHRMTTGQAPHLPRMIQGFCDERFLYDYLDDAKLLGRLNRVMHRVGLPTLPISLLSFLPVARREVGRRRPELLAGESSALPDQEQRAG